MKKIKSLLTLGIAVALLSSAGLAACGKTVDEYALSAYRGENKDENGNTVYNTELFYSNSVQQGYADPQVMDDTAQTGYYYLYGTSGNFAATRTAEKGFTICFSAQRPTIATKSGTTLTTRSPES